MDDDDKKSDDTEKKEETPPTTPPPAPPAPAPDNDVREAIARLEGIVTGLAERVEQIGVTTRQDEAPVTKPWTHRSFG